MNDDYFISLIKQSIDNYLLHNKIDLNSLIIRLEFYINEINNLSSEQKHNLNNSLNLLEDLNAWLLDDNDVTSDDSYVIHNTLNSILDEISS